jgi:hypothetical protein
MRHNYTPEQIRFLRKGYRKMRIPELTVAFNKKFGMDKTEIAVKCALSNRGYTCGRPTGNTKGTYRIFSREQAAFVEANYRNLDRVQLTAELNEAFGTSFTVGQIRSFTHNHRIRSGRTGRFEKGSHPWNTGTKGLTHRNRTSFKKGNVPASIKPLGHERVDSKDGYILVKIAETDPYTGFPTRYKLKHIVIWEQANGPVPKGMAVIFKDGDRTNCVLDNLALVSRAELLRLNQVGYAETPGELKPSVLALAKLETKMFGKRKEVSNAT